MPREIIDRSPDTENDMQNSRDPDELLGKGSRECKVCPGEDERDDQDENKEDDSVRVEREIVACMVDSSTTIPFIRAITLERKA